jgi:hypothetical protein
MSIPEMGGIITAEKVGEEWENIKEGQGIPVRIIDSHPSTSSNDKYYAQVLVASASAAQPVIYKNGEFGRSQPSAHWIGIEGGTVIVPQSTKKVMKVGRNKEVIELIFPDAMLIDPKQLNDMDWLTESLQSLKEMSSVGVPQLDEAIQFLTNKRVQ